MLDKLKPIPYVKRGVWLKAHARAFTTKRSLLRRSLGCHYDGASVPINDVRDQYSQVRGALRRILIKTPRIDPRMMARFRSFVRMWLRTEGRRHGLVPLTDMNMMSFDEWLDSLENCPNWRKTELKAAKTRVEQGMAWRKVALVKCFGKVEALEGAKENRIIDARVDEAKVMFGPFVKSIERQVYEFIPEFVKHIPICQYPQHISDVCTPHAGEKVVATDYTSFEGHFAPELIRVCEGALYRYMAGRKWSELARLFVSMLSGENHCQSPLMTFKVSGCRMSGDMCTSLGNGFTNLMIMKFLVRENGGQVRGFVEGDDGLFAVRGPVPTKAQYQALGFNVKMDVVDEPQHASFCGQVYANETKEVLVDPLYVLLTVGWTSSDQKHGSDKAMKGLLRAKAISLAYQSPRCPVVSVLSKKLLELTAGVKPIFPTFRGLRDYWELRKLGRFDMLSAEVESKLSMGPDDASRGVVHKVFGWSVDEQLTMERYIRSWTKISPWSHPIVDRKVPRDYVDFWELCTMSFPPGSYHDAPFRASWDWDTNLDARGISFSTMHRLADGTEARAAFDPGRLYGRTRVHQRSYE